MNAPAVTIDLTGIAASAAAAVFSIATPIFLLWVQNHIKNQAAAAVVANAVKNAVGAMQQAVQQGIVLTNPKAKIPGLSGVQQVGLQYALDHAGDEATRLGFTPAVLADKISAQLGLVNIASNLAASNLSTAAGTGMQTAPPLAAVAVPLGATTSPKV